MGDGKPGKNAPQSPQDEIHTEDFQLVLKALLAAYQSAVEQDLKLAKNPDQLTKDAESKPPNCEDEIALANQIFGKFFTEEVAVRMLPPEGRQQLGPVTEWRWCLQHIRCCIIFGWLVCRGPRTFRAFSYYLYRYWLCVRETLGNPVSSPPSEEQRRDFTLLVDELAKAFPPILRTGAGALFDDGCECRFGFVDLAFLYLEFLLFFDKGLQQFQ